MAEFIDTIKTFSDPETGAKYFLCKSSTGASIILMQDSAGSFYTSLTDTAGARHCKKILGTGADAITKRGLSSDDYQLKLDNNSAFPIETSRYGDQLAQDIKNILDGKETITPQEESQTIKKESPIFQSLHQQAVKVAKETDYVSPTAEIETLKKQLDAQRQEAQEYHNAINKATEEVRKTEDEILGHNAKSSLRDVLNKKNTAPTLDDELAKDGLTADPIEEDPTIAELNRQIAEMEAQADKRAKEAADLSQINATEKAEHESFEIGQQELQDELDEFNRDILGLEHEENDASPFEDITAPETQVQQTESISETPKNSSISPSEFAHDISRGMMRDNARSTESINTADAINKLKGTDYSKLSLAEKLQQNVEDASANLKYDEASPYTFEINDKYSGGKTKITTLVGKDSTPAQNFSFYDEKERMTYFDLQREDAYSTKGISAFGKVHEIIMRDTNGDCYYSVTKTARDRKTGEVKRQQSEIRKIEKVSTVKKADNFGNENEYYEIALSDGSVISKRLTDENKQTIKDINALVSGKRIKATQVRSESAFWAHASDVSATPTQIKEAESSRKFREKQQPNSGLKAETPEYKPEEYTFTPEQFAQARQAQEARIQAELAEKAKEEELARQVLAEVQEAEERIVAKAAAGKKTAAETPQPQPAKPKQPQPAKPSAKKKAERAVTRKKVAERTAPKIQGIQSALKLKTAAGKTLRPSKNFPRLYQTMTYVGPDRDRSRLAQFTRTVDGQLENVATLRKDRLDISASQFTEEDFKQLQSMGLVAQDAVYDPNSTISLAVGGKNGISAFNNENETEITVQNQDGAIYSCTLDPLGIRLSGYNANGNACVIDKRAKLENISQNDILNVAVSSEFLKAMLDPNNETIPTPKNIGNIPPQMIGVCLAEQTPNADGSISFPTGKNVNAKFKMIAVPTGEEIDGVKQYYYLAKNTERGTTFVYDGNGFKPFDRYNFIEAADGHETPYIGLHQGQTSKSVGSALVTRGLKIPTDEKGNPNKQFMASVENFLNSDPAISKKDNAPIEAGNKGQREGFTTAHAGNMMAVQSTQISGRDITAQESGAQQPAPVSELGGENGIAGGISGREAPAPMQETPAPDGGDIGGGNGDGEEPVRPRPKANTPGERSNPYVQPPSTQKLVTKQPPKLNEDWIRYGGFAVGVLLLILAFAIPGMAVLTPLLLGGGLAIGLGSQFLANYASVLNENPYNKLANMYMKETAAKKELEAEESAGKFWEKETEFGAVNDNYIELHDALLANKDNGMAFFKQLEEQGLWDETRMHDFLAQGNVETRNAFSSDLKRIMELSALGNLTPAQAKELKQLKREFISDYGFAKEGMSEQELDEIANKAFSSTKAMRGAVINIDNLNALERQRNELHKEVGDTLQFASWRTIEKIINQPNVDIAQFVKEHTHDLARRALLSKLTQSEMEAMFETFPQLNEPALDKNGQPILDENNKPMTVLAHAVKELEQAEKQVQKMAKTHADNLKEMSAVDKVLDTIVRVVEAPTKESDAFEDFDEVLMNTSQIQNATGDLLLSLYQEQCQRQSASRNLTTPEPQTSSIDAFGKKLGSYETNVDMSDFNNLCYNKQQLMANPAIAKLIANEIISAGELALSTNGLSGIEIGKENQLTDHIREVVSARINELEEANSRRPLNTEETAEYTQLRQADGCLEVLANEAEHRLTAKEQIIPDAEDALRAKLGLKTTKDKADGREYVDKDGSVVSTGTLDNNGLQVASKQLEQLIPGWAELDNDEKTRRANFYASCKARIQTPRLTERNGANKAPTQQELDALKELDSYFAQIYSEGYAETVLANKERTALADHHKNIQTVTKARNKTLAMHRTLAGFGIDNQDISQVIKLATENAGNDEIARSDVAQALVQIHGKMKIVDQAKDGVTRTTTLAELINLEENDMNDDNRVNNKKVSEKAKTAKQKVKEKKLACNKRFKDNVENGAPADIIGANQAKLEARHFKKVEPDANFVKQTGQEIPESVQQAEDKELDFIKKSDGILRSLVSTNKKGQNPMQRFATDKASPQTASDSVKKLQDRLKGAFSAKEYAKLSAEINWDAVDKEINSNQFTTKKFFELRAKIIKIIAEKEKKLKKIAKQKREKAVKKKKLKEKKIKGASKSEQVAAKNTIEATSLRVANKRSDEAKHNALREQLGQEIQAQHQAQAQPRQSTPDASGPSAG